MTDEPSRTYDVVRNIFGQYSIWPAGRALPNGWDTVGVSGTEETCLAHIDEVWTDITPQPAASGR